MKIPPEIQAIFDIETEGLEYGEVHFICTIRNGKPRFAIKKEISLYPETTGQKIDRGNRA